MTNINRTIGDRLQASWQALAHFIHGMKTPCAANENDYGKHAYRSALVTVGRAVVHSEETVPLYRMSCLAAIAGLIDSGVTKREDIVKGVAVMHQYHIRYPFIGFLLKQHTGTDPSQHLWFKDENRAYRLHGTALKQAA
jgi:hypothetical protein